METAVTYGRQVTYSGPQGPEYYRVLCIFPYCVPDYNPQEVMKWF